MSRRRDDDVVLLGPGSLRVTIPVLETPTACAGAVAAYLLRRIAYRAGAYAPGIDDVIFEELHAGDAGGTLADVSCWFARRETVLHGLGYRVELRRANWPTRDVLAWLDAGRDCRAAVLATRYGALHPPRTLRPAEGDSIAHAVGLVIERRDLAGSGEVVMIDPWPRNGDPRGRIHPALEAAHGQSDHLSLLFEWIDRR
jgi:hypothetical protein